ncbi:MAG: PepSY-associated TM helix domain-containing protein [Gemmatimonadaceae bacterium]
MSSSAVVSNEDAPRPTTEPTSRVHRARRQRPLRLRVHSLLRWLHIYTSMVSLLVVLFFAGTGVTLNHPDWLAAERTEELTGQLPATWRTARGIDWLVVAEHLRATHGVHGTVTDRREDDREGSLAFRAPGYSADAFIDVRDGSYKLAVSYQGAVGMLNDLHRGRDAGRAWAWLIGVAGVFLVFLSLTGLGLLFYLKKVRIKALLVMTAGAALVIVLAKLVT